MPARSGTRAITSGPLKTLFPSMSILPTLYCTPSSIGTVRYPLLRRCLALLLGLQLRLDTPGPLLLRLPRRSGGGGRLLEVLRLFVLEPLHARCRARRHQGQALRG